LSGGAEKKRSDKRSSGSAKVVRRAGGFIMCEAARTDFYRVIARLFFPTRGAAVNRGDVKNL
jgi:hypothetical protein